VAKRLLRREHIVAASLVGSVVVVVGFASGLGSRPGTGASAAPAEDQRQPAATAPVTTTQAQPPQGNSRGPSGGSPRPGGGGVAPVTTAPPTTTGTHHTGHPTPPPATTPPPTSTTPPPACDPGLLPAAVETILDTVGRATAAIGLPGLGPSTVDPAAPGLPALPEGTPLDQFIATCSAPTTQPAPTTPTTTPTGHG
jgi:hypothetical protein